MIILSVGYFMILKLICVFLTFSNSASIVLIFLTPYSQGKDPEFYIFLNDPFLCEHLVYFERLMQVYRVFRNQRASLAVQWLRICFAMQGTRIQSLIRKDPTCCRATKPKGHNCRDCTPEPSSSKHRGRHPEPVLHKKRSRRSEKPGHHSGE